MKFLVPNYSCPQIPVLSLLCPQLNLLNPPRKKIPGYATACAFSVGLLLMLCLNLIRHI